MNAEQHKELLDQYISRGGNAKIAKACKVFSLERYAKLKYEIKKLADGDWQIANSQKEEAKSEPPTANSQKPTAQFKDLVSDYPVVLHSVFRVRGALWLELCSLKIQLNNIPDAQEEDAMAIQWKIHQKFKEFDQCQSILKHYREHKRIIIPQVEKDFGQMSELELFKERNNLRTLITRRGQTIAKMEAEYEQWQEQNEGKQNPRMIHSINLKKEQLQGKINELLECEKLLENEREKNNRSLGVEKC